MSLTHRLPTLATVALLATAALAGCVDSSTGQGATLFGSFDEAKAADGPALEPTDADSRIRAKLLSPAGYQALAPGANEFVVLVYSQRTQEPVLDATVALETDSGESARLAEDGHGVYAGELTLTASGETPARLTVVDADGRTLVFPLEIASYASTEEVSATNSLVYEPIDGDGSLRMKLLNPEEPLETERGQAPFTFLLFDADTGQPVTGAETSLRSWMPPHALPEGGRMPGHGTHSEVDPVHHRLGIYQGRTNIVMNGTWWTNVTVAVDGQETAFRATFDVGGHDRFRTAMALDGPEIEMTDADGTATLTAKLVRPEDPANASRGNQTVWLLLHRPEADRPAPVPMGRVELDIHKHAHDGGTVDANTSRVVHGGSGLWNARTNLTESGEWSVHVEVQTLDGSVFSGKFEVTVGQRTATTDDTTPACHGGCEH